MLFIFYINIDYNQKQALFNETNLGYTALKPSHDIENDLTAYCYKANLNRYINTG